VRDAQDVGAVVDRDSAAATVRAGRGRSGECHEHYEEKAE
jgi:hypothetical protein